MRAVVQRVVQASVSVVEAGALREVARIGPGLLVLLGIRTDDTEADARYLAEKVAYLRVFEDEAGRLNRSLGDIRGSALVVSNFTLYGDCRKGRRPSFTDAAPADNAAPLYQLFGQQLASTGITVQYGAFGAHMHILLVNDGPVTLLLDSRKEF
ncbi:MAG: D-aminoacyl-tRNA deacylase [Chloroherpetonaceae bacterium]|nr:D-aminoacyl-tRNA deacylase [Chthonomonadaceae bacterium]MDW8207286.1 D-aminoacyl-tRNA deacylase [Chloroherpetonaceae bacterium]